MLLCGWLVAFSPTSRATTLQQVCLSQHIPFSFCCSCATFNCVSITNHFWLGTNMTLRGAAFCFPTGPLANALGYSERTPWIRAQPQAGQTNAVLLTSLLIPSFVNVPGPHPPPRSKKRAPGSMNLFSSCSSCSPLMGDLGTVSRHHLPRPPDHSHITLHPDASATALF